MALRLEDKQKLVTEVSEVASSAESAIAAEYRGMSVAQMTEFRSKARAEGVDPYEAIVLAALSRFRPILMSAITTILGVAPLIVVRDPLFYSMAVVIAAGLALGTVLTLVVVPALYALFVETFKVQPLPKPAES